MTATAIDNEARIAALPLYKQRALEAGYDFECDCGELHNTQDSAWACRKCPKYLTSDYSERMVFNLRTGAALTAYDTELDESAPEPFIRGSVIDGDEEFRKFMAMNPGLFQ